MDILLLCLFFLAVGWAVSVILLAAHMDTLEQRIRELESWRKRGWGNSE